MRKPQVGLETYIVSKFNREVKKSIPILKDPVPPRVCTASACREVEVGVKVGLR